MGTYNHRGVFTKYNAILVPTAGEDLLAQLASAGLSQFKAYHCNDRNYLKGFAQQNARRQFWEFLELKLQPFCCCTAERKTKTNVASVFHRAHVRQTS